MTLTQYSQEIFSLAKNREDKIFYNNSAEHAAVVHDALVKNATSHICIFSESMSTDISNNVDYCSDMRSFLDSDLNHKVSVILTGDTSNLRDKEIMKVFSDFRDQVDIYTTSCVVTYEGRSCHFTVVDDRAFRLETNVRDHIAFGNFNSPEQARVLSQQFNLIRENRGTKKWMDC